MSPPLLLSVNVPAAVCNRAPLVPTLPLPFSVKVLAVINPAPVAAPLLFKTTVPAPALIAAVNPKVVVFNVTFPPPMANVVSIVVAPAVNSTFPPLVLPSKFTGVAVFCVK